MRDSTPYPARPDGGYVITRMITRDDGRRFEEDVTRARLKVVALRHARMLSECGTAFDVWAVYGSERHLVGVAQNGRMSYV